MKKALFICKRRSYGVSSGLANSARFVADMLNRNGITSKVVDVIDSNCIDAEVHKFKPTHVIIEAIWVVPSKFVELSMLHPNVIWVVRIHSETPFLAMEGIAIEWIKKYDDLKRIGIPVVVSPNSKSLSSDLMSSLGMITVTLPNYYNPLRLYEKPPEAAFQNTRGVINVGCFGAIRPLKNTLIQAMAAMSLAEDQKKKLRFHVNGTRLEQKGEEPLKNVRALFKGTKHELVEHVWMDHYEFLSVVKSMDIGMQVSFSESFCIVAADFVGLKIPLVGSPSIEWLSSYCQADPNSLDDIKEKMAWALRWNWLRPNASGLVKYNKWSKEKWLSFLGKHV